MRPEEIGKTIQRGSGGSGRRGQMLENRQRGNLHIQPLWGPKGHGSEPHGQSYLSCFAIDFSTVLQLSSDETMNFQKERLGCRAYILFCCWWLDSTWAKEIRTEGKGSIYCLPSQTLPLSYSSSCE